MIIILQFIQNIIYFYERKLRRVSYMIDNKLFDLLPAPDISWTQEDGEVIYDLTLRVLFHHEERVRDYRIELQSRDQWDEIMSHLYDTCTNVGARLQSRIDPDDWTSRSFEARVW